MNMATVKASAVYKVPSPMAGVLTSVLLLCLAVLAGMVATTASPIAIALLVGLGVGGVLLVRTDISIWLILVGALLINGVVGLAFPSLTKVSWLFSMLGFFLLAGGFLTLLTTRKAAFPLPGFVTLLLVMMGVSVATSLFSEGGLVEVFAGTKRTYQLLGLTLAIALMPVDKAAYKRFGTWLKFLFLVALIQLPVAIFERIVLVPKRVGMGNGVVPIDIVSGTFEASLEGGGSSSVMCIFLIVVLAYVFSAWREKLIGTGRMVIFALLLGGPLFVGETKLVLVLLPTMFVLVFATQIRRNPVVAGLAMAIAGGLVVVLAWVYFSVFAVQNMTPEQQFQKAIDYNFGSVGYYDRYSLNRTTATTFWVRQHGFDQPVETIFGHGIGSSYSGAASLAPGHLNRRYPFMAINLTGLSTLLWDTGLLGTALFLSALLAAWRASARLMKTAMGAVDRARVTALRVSLAFIAFSLLYSNSMFSGMSHETIVAFTFGYLAWMVRAQKSGLMQATHTEQCASST